jgi:hypothetical protein
LYRIRAIGGKWLCVADLARRDTTRRSPVVPFPALLFGGGPDNNEVGKLHQLRRRPPRWGLRCSLQPQGFGECEQQRGNTLNRFHDCTDRS